jgi:hypothetical protein
MAHLTPRTIKRNKVISLFLFHLLVYGSSCVYSCGQSPGGR